MVCIIQAATTTISSKKHPSFLSTRGRITLSTAAKYPSLNSVRDVPVLGEKIPRVCKTKDRRFLNWIRKGHTSQCWGLFVVLSVEGLNPICRIHDANILLWEPLCSIHNMPYRYPSQDGDIWETPYQGPDRKGIQCMSTSCSRNVLRHVQNLQLPHALSHGQ